LVVDGRISMPIGLNPRLGSEHMSANPRWPQAPVTRTSGLGIILLCMAKV
jgi:hypothetical protein